MVERMGLFAWIRKTSFTHFFLSWIVSIFIFTLIYLLLTLKFSGLQVDGINISFGLLGLIDSLYVSLLAATIFGVAKLTATNIFSVVVYIQIIFSAIIFFILIDKILHKYIFPKYHTYHIQDKKINTVVFMMSIFRDDIDRIKSRFKAKTKNEIDIKEIEAMIDGLYVSFLDIDKLFSVRNIHKHRITTQQSLMVITNIEDSLHKLLKFIDFLEDHKLEWKDKSVEFWLRYILETADRIVLHFEEEKIKNPKLIICLENISELTESIEKKI